MKQTTNTYRNHNEPQIGVQVVQGNGLITIITSVGDQLSSLVLPQVAALKVLETLAEALEHHVIDYESGTVRYYKDED